MKEQGKAGQGSGKGPLAYLFTTFARPSETFLRRELDAVRSLGVDVRVVSLWGGAGEGVRTFPLGQMLTLIWRSFRELILRPAPYRDLLEHMLDRDIPSWLNFGENWRGIGCAILLARELKAARTRRCHAVWATMPAAAAWVLHHIAGIPYTMGAHAYDIHEDGGDWLLPLKLRDAALVHCSSEAACERVLALGCEPGKVVVIRRGLTHIPATLKPLREGRAALPRLVSVGRLVEKKGYCEQLRLLAALAEAGLDFEAAIVGSGPKEAELKALAAQLGLSKRLRFTGWLDEASVNAELDRADAFIFTGKVAQSGDRDGLPNALAEAMARGLPVLTTNVGATAEVIRNGENGYILPIDEPEAWCKALDSICNDDAFCENLRRRARRWIEDNFDAMGNAAKLLQEAEERLGKQSA